MGPSDARGRTNGAESLAVSEPVGGPQVLIRAPSRSSRRVAHLPKRTHLARVSRACNRERARAARRRSPCAGIVTASGQRFGNKAKTLAARSAKGSRSDGVRRCMDVSPQSAISAPRSRALSPMGRRHSGTPSGLVGAYVSWAPTVDNSFRCALMGCARALALGECPRTWTGGAAHRRPLRRARRLSLSEGRMRKQTPSERSSSREGEVIGGKSARSDPKGGNGPLWTLGKGRL